MIPDPGEAKKLIEHTGKGYSQVFEELFNRQRVRLHKAIALSMKPRMPARENAAGTDSGKAQPRSRQIISHIQNGGKS